MRPFAARSLPLAISRRTGASIRPARASPRCQPVLPILRGRCKLRCQYGLCERHELYDLRDSAARANGSGLAAVGAFWPYAPQAGIANFRPKKLSNPPAAPNNSGQAGVKPAGTKPRRALLTPGATRLFLVSLLSTTHCNCWPEPEYLYNTSQYPCRCTFAKTPAYGLEKPYLARTACPSGESTKSMNAWPILGLEPVRATAMG